MFMMFFFLLALLNFVFFENAEKKRKEAKTNSSEENESWKKSLSAKYLIKLASQQKNAINYVAVITKCIGLPLVYNHGILIRFSI